MPTINDISTHQGSGYKLAEMVAGGYYDNVLIYEFHERIDPNGAWNTDTGLEHFIQRNDKSHDYSNFISEAFPDDYPAVIHVAMKIANEWIIAGDCGANYYGGYGPTGILRLREECKKNNIFIFVVEEIDFEGWKRDLLEKNDSVIPQSMLNEESHQFARIIKSLEQLTAQFQRKPQRYQYFVEDNIRDEMLTVLAPIFEGRAVGEATSHKGKTDIMVRTKDGLNEHIFELKIWSGVKMLRDTIEQLFGYIVSHNKHSGIIMLSYNKNFTEVLKTIEDYLKDAYNYNPIEKIMENQFRYTAKHPIDEGKKLQIHLIAINLYVPKENNK